MNNNKLKKNLLSGFVLVGLLLIVFLMDQAQTTGFATALSNNANIVSISFLGLVFFLFLVVLALVEVVRVRNNKIRK